MLAISLLILLLKFYDTVFAGIHIYLLRFYILLTFVFVVFVFFDLLCLCVHEGKCGFYCYAYIYVCVQQLLTVAIFGEVMLRAPLSYSRQAMSGKCYQLKSQEITLKKATFMYHMLCDSDLS